MASLNHTGRRGRFNRGPWRRANAPSFFSVIDSPLGFAASLASSYIVASSKMRPAPPALSSSPKMAALACASRRLGAPLPNRRKPTRYAWAIHERPWVRKDGAFEKAGVEVIAKNGGGSGARLKAPKAKGKRK